MEEPRSFSASESASLFAFPLALVAIISIGYFAGTWIKRRSDPLKKPRMPNPNKFEPRTSYLDTGGTVLCIWQLPQEDSQKSELDKSLFRGFSSMVCSFGGFYLLVTFVDNWLEIGCVFTDAQVSLLWYTLERIWELAYGIIALFVFGIASSFSLAKAVQLRWIKPQSIFYRVLQHSAQTIVVMGPAFAAFYADWVFSQKLCFTMQATVMFMKMHSYSTVNGALAAKHFSADDSASEYPRNITLPNILWFSVYPTLVYEPSYPRRAHIRWGYVLEKLFLTAVLLCIAYLLLHNAIRPGLEVAATGQYIKGFLKILMPFALLYLLLFYLIFDVILNGVGELTYFADRRFYEDWWNCTTFNEFARRWNRPVHEFLLRHLYIPGLEMGFPRWLTSATTFLFSIALHELILASCLRVVRPWILALTVSCHFPILYIMPSAFFKGRRIGALIFWLGMLVGPAMLATLYFGEFIARNGRW